MRFEALKHVRLQRDLVRAQDRGPFGDASAAAFEDGFGERAQLDLDAAVNYAQGLT
ncbi:MAG: hypothetical protein IPG47_14740 [Thermoflexaceae bacterium]|nr:hypothetical protein [Thermoflexaceae bacterium]